MVYTNNDLKIKTGSDKNKANSLPVYPFNVDVPSFPERKYLAGIYWFARFSYVSLFISILIVALIAFRAFSQNVDPSFIYWNSLDNKFEFKTKRIGEKPKENVKNIFDSTYLNEFFIETYLTKRFSISDSFVKNYNNWCDCSYNKTPVSKMGDFNLEQDCYVCSFSTSSVYKTFLDNEYSAYTKLAESGLIRNVKILDMKKFYEAQDSSEQSLMDLILNKQKNIKVYLGYRVDFILEDVRDNKVVNRTVLTSYLNIVGPKQSPQRRFVSEASFMFNPSYEQILRDYKQKMERGQNVGK